MIFTESTIKISNNVSKMDSTIVLYRGDKNVEIRFTILQSPFKYSNTAATNVIESTNASYGQLVIKTPNDKLFTNDLIIKSKKILEVSEIATKKYVDDKVSGLPQISFNEAGELVVTINGVSKTFVPKNV